MKATLGQAAKLLSLFEETPGEQVQSLLGSGLLADLRDGNTAEVNRDEFRRIIGIKPLPRTKLPRTRNVFRFCILPFGFKPLASNNIYRYYLKPGAERVKIRVMGESIHYESLAWNVLKVVGGGILLASLLVAPNLGVMLGPVLRGRNSCERLVERRRQIQQALRRLRERRYVEYEERGGKTYVLITEKGKKRIRQFEFDSLVLPRPPKKWDDKWRVIIFDIPEGKRRERMIFREKLNNIGFFILQKSVYAYPYSCEDEIDFLCQFLGVAPYVYYFETSTLGNAEGKMRRRFGLL